MKKVLSLLLCVLLVISVVTTITLTVTAEETVAEETDTSSDITSDEVADSAGYMKNIDEDKSRTFLDDYSVASTYIANSTYGFRTADGYRIDATYSSKSAKTSFALENETDSVGNVNNSYFKFKYPYNSTYNYPSHLYKLQFTELQTGEKIHLSVDLKNDDIYYEKYLMFSSNRKVYSSNYCYKKILTMKTDGTLTFSGLSDVTVPYEVGKWYHIDMVFDITEAVCDSSSAVTSCTASVTYYIDGESVGTASDIGLVSSSQNYLTFVGYTINGVAQETTVDDDGNTVYPRTQDSTLSADNFLVKILSSDESTGLTPIGTLTANGSIKLEEDFSSDYTVHTSTNYRYVKGAFGFSLRYSSSSYDDYVAPNEKGWVSSDGDNPYKAANEEYLRFASSSDYTNAVLYDRHATDDLQIKNAESDILYISVDMMAEDYNSNKKMIFNGGWNNDNAHYVMVTMDTDGYIGFQENGQYEGEKVPYTPNVWYDIDVVYNFATGVGSYYIDGREICKTNIAYEADKLKAFKFWIDKPEANADGSTAYSYLAVDNLKMELRPSNNPPKIQSEGDIYRIISTSIPNTFTVADGNIYEASMLILDTDATTQTTLIAAAYNANGELTGISATPAYDISSNPHIKLTVGATDTVVKVFVLDNYNNLKPIQTALEFKK